MSTLSIEGPGNKQTPEAKIVNGAGLPNELFTCILSHLRKYEDLENVALTCRRMNALATQAVQQLFISNVRMYHSELQTYATQLLESYSRACHTPHLHSRIDPETLAEWPQNLLKASKTLSPFLEEGFCPKADPRFLQDLRIMSSIPIMNCLHNLQILMENTIDALGQERINASMSYRYLSILPTANAPFRIDSAEFCKFRPMLHIDSLRMGDFDWIMEPPESLLLSITQACARQINATEMSATLEHCDVDLIDGIRGALTPPAAHSWGWQQVFLLLLVHCLLELNKDTEASMLANICETRETAEKAQRMIQAKLAGNPIQITSDQEGTPNIWNLFRL